VSTASRLEVPDFAGVCPIASPASQRFNSTRGVKPRRSFRQSRSRFVRRGFAQTGTLSVLLCPGSTGAASKCPILQGSALLRALIQPPRKSGCEEPRRFVQRAGSCARDYRPKEHAERAVCRPCSTAVLRRSKPTGAPKAARVVVSTTSRLEVPDFAGVCPIASPASQRFNSTRGAEPRRFIHEVAPGSCAGDSLKPAR
jgi:hypothetical protein